MARTLRKSSADRREEIVAAVFRIVGERGLTALTTASLAAEVGLTGGALYRHFASLDEILTEAVRQGVERVDATFPDPALSPAERLMELARERVRLLGDEPGLVWLLRSEQALLSLPATAVEIVRATVRRSRAFLLDALRDGAADGSIRDDVDAELLLVPVTATIHRAIDLRGRRSSGLDPELVLRTLARLLEPPARPRPRITTTSTAVDEETQR